jgi:hypothetical protein
MNARTQTQKCTMELRSRQNTPINLTSGERLRQLILIVDIMKLFEHHFLNLESLNIKMIID